MSSLKCRKESYLIFDDRGFESTARTRSSLIVFCFAYDTAPTCFDDYPDHYHEKKNDNNARIDEPLNQVSVASIREWFYEDVADRRTNRQKLFHRFADPSPFSLGNYFLSDLFSNQIDLREIG